ncbi:unnamed protein product [Caenorhabditis brenneri]
MNNNNAHLLYILNDGMTANIPKIVQATNELLDKPQTAQQGTAKAKPLVKRPLNAFILFSQAEGKNYLKHRPENEAHGAYLSRMWTDLDSDRKKVYKDEAKRRSDTYNADKQTSSTKKPGKTFNQPMAKNTSAGDDWFEKMAVTTASDPPFSSFNVQPTIDANWRPCSPLI